MSFSEQVKARTGEVETIIEKYLPPVSGYQKTVLEAMNYSVNVGGKRIRPMMMLEVNRLMGQESPCLYPFMAAIEMIHTYSLVHDDLPAMDNDEYRRGKKTTHVVYGEAMAILTGDALLNYAYETAVKAFEAAENETQFKQTAKALQVLAEKAGIFGMVGGQTADVEAEDKGIEATEELLMYIHKNKTAALIEAAMMVGAILGGADHEAISAIEKCAYNIGIAFQIQDDILDVTGTLEELGKPIGSDEKNHKVTYVTMHGLEESKARVEELSKEAIEILKGFPNRNEFLENLVEQMIYRTK